MKESTKKKLKKILAGALCALALIGTTALIGNLSNGFQNLNPKDWDVSVRNENNLIAEDLFKDRVKSDTGVTVEAKNGVLTLKGQNGSTTDDFISLGKVKLTEGTYRFTTAQDGENDATSLYTYYMCLSADGGATKIIADKEVFDVTAETEYEIFVVVVADKSVDGVKLYPMIVEGSENQKYYDISGNNK